MNFLQIVQRLKRESGRSTSAILSPSTLTSPTVDDQRLIDYAADAWTEINREPHDWKWRRTVSVTKPLVTAKREYSATDFALTDLWRFKRQAAFYAPTVYQTGLLSTEYALEWIDYNEYRARYVATQVLDSQPIHWSISPSEQLLIGPGILATPGYSVRFDYIESTPALALDADTPPMPSEFHMVIVWRALMDVATFDAAPEVYTRALNNYEKVLNALIRDQGEEIWFDNGTLA